MPRKIPPLDLNDLSQRYIAGERIVDIAESLGVSAAVIYKRLRATGVIRSPKEARATIPRVEKPWVSGAVRMHLNGATQSEIANAFAVSQASVSRVLLDRGYRTDRGEAERRKWATMSPEQRAAQVEAAHIATTGRVLPEAEVVKRAATKEVRQSHATNEERSIADAVGMPHVLQKAVGRYNLDIAFCGTVSVELFGGGWHAHGRHRERLPKRTMDVADAGFNQLFIWTHHTHPLNVGLVANDVRAFLDRTSSDPAFRRQYRVIWGDGQLLAAGSVDDDNLTLIPSGIRGANPGRGGN